MKERILIVDDEPRFVRLIEANLQTEGYGILKARNGKEAIEQTVAEKPDLVLLDVMMPELDGFQACARIREFSNVPIIMLTAKGEEDQRIKGLDMGADDYVVKPFSAGELLARVRALLRRSALRTDQAMIKVADLVIDPFSRDVRRGNREINLTQKEYALLEYLARHAGRPVTREQISQQVWKQDFDPTTNIVDVYINYVRKKVDVDGEVSLVQTVRGVGYMLQG